MSKTIPHITAQIRLKQLAVRDSQKEVLQNILDNKNPDISETVLTSQLMNQLAENYKTSLSINSYLKTQDINNVGYPIKFNKTPFQLEMAMEWANNDKEALISLIERGIFYHGLSNSIKDDELPILQSSSLEQYWGNENASVTSVMLYSLAKVFNIKVGDLTGAAMQFPMYSQSYKLPENIVPESYPFATNNNMLLFGDYQYGGHRYLKEQFMFGPEDCSSALGKATYLSDQLVKSITTRNIHQAYSDENNIYHYKPITILHSSVSDEQLKLIQPGDIYLTPPHAAMIATVPNNYSIITTLQFDRDLEISAKKLGGGCMDYNLSEKVKERDIYILRPTVDPIKEDYSLTKIIELIDHKYADLFPQGPVHIAGDCQMIFNEGDFVI